ncbi:hypothetical protein [Bradyrhizobium sp. ARR65]|uniref:hypothetical protein n=1 Tax=Bradyrhizobium sp. ARR65 TaxID=1040989 RepID=UPI000464F760|nr:hypothetical protein [Bradyrhizobium sp. ARR65]
MVTNSPVHFSSGERTNSITCIKQQRGYLALYAHIGIVTDPMELLPRLSTALRARLSHSRTWFAS